MGPGPDQQGGAAARSNQPFSGYYQRPARPDDSFLTQVGPGTPGGEYLRRFWHPFMMSSELRDTPKAMRLLGEDLVVFRDQGGRLGLLHRHCIHRGTSLEFGIPAPRGIRCCYHGWLFDIDGTVLETPAEPENSRIKQNFCQGAYQVREYHGLIFAYMGPPELTPEFPLYDTFGYPDGNRLVPLKLELPCNWVQISENAADPIHNAFLHVIVSGAQFAPHFAVMPALEFVESPLGFICSATRRIKDNVFIRASDMIMPNVAQFIGGPHMIGEKEDFSIAAFLTRWAVPLDDHNSLYIGFTGFNSITNGEGRIKEETIGVGKLNLIGQTADRPYVERQREPGDYDAIGSQGPIANRQAEHLGTTDRGVVLFRRLLARGIKEVEEGKAPSLPRLYGDEAVRTYCHALVMKVPGGSDIGIGDMRSLGEFGRDAAGIVIASDRLPPQERETDALERIRPLLADKASVGAK
ncbi:MAG TPA: Rieske 2Fe-2S domain-containing protein [Stellaceae bacterium]|jgi:nitrite reductase/ring-hydroxylating ferredoxin subunit